MEDNLSKYEEPLFKAIKYFGSQQELANAIGVSQQAVNNWLNRSKKIPYLQALKIELYTEGKINIESLTEEENELTFLLKNSAFLKGAPIAYLPLDKILIGEKRCPIYKNRYDLPKTDFFKISSMPPILVGDDNVLIACECRLRSYTSLHSKVKVYRLQAKEIVKNGFNIDPLICNLPISERVEIGLFIEKELGSRQGKRTDLELPQISAEVKSGIETRALATKISGFGNHFTYTQAKEVVKNGIPEVIQAMDASLLSISKSNHIASLPHAEQELFIAMMHQKEKR